MGRLLLRRLPRPIRSLGRRWFSCRRRQPQATVDMIWTQGHQLTYEEVLQGKEWLEK